LGMAILAANNYVESGVSDSTKFDAVLLVGMGLHFVELRGWGHKSTKRGTWVSSETENVLVISEHARQDDLEQGDRGLGVTQIFLPGGSCFPECVSATRNSGDG